MAARASIAEPIALPAPRTNTRAIRAIATAALAAATLLGRGQPAPAQAANPSQILSDDIQATAQDLRTDALKGTGAMALVESLATEVGPRPAGSAADARAVGWAVRTLGSLGFSNVHTEKVKVPRWERGAESGEIVTPFPQRVALAALGGSVGTPGSGIEAPVVEVADLDGLAKLEPAKVKGKIVFFNTVMARTRDLSGYAKAVTVRGDGAARAGAAGAVAVLVRSIGTDNNRLPHTGATTYAASGNKIPAAALSVPDANLLAAELATGKPVTFRLRLGARSLPEGESANVIAEVPGREKPGEIVLLGCHLDSWDLGTGALDDGAGCGIVIESARRIAKLAVRPRRTLRVVLFANEEFGLSGAIAYAAAHAAELPRHVLALESDLGSGRIWRVSSKVAPESQGWVRELARLLGPLKVTMDGNDAEGGADLIPLAKAGVPQLALEQDATAYFDFHHSANDTADKISALDLDFDVAAWTAAVYAAAELPGDFGRIKETAPGP
ncbi:MAG TPA: M28 family peptidase [Thermoanaerobaculia bacterium]|nr:M28 family peptidase [Thermoanaerobaculia bacterium]